MLTFKIKKVYIKKLLKKIILCSTSLILFIVFSETILRVLDFPPIRLSDEFTAITKCTKETDEYSENFIFNNLGLRGHKDIKPKEKNTYRIVCLGDSWTFGLNVPLEKSYPVLLETYLKNHLFKEKLEVINAGYPGRNVEEAHLFLLENMATLTPDCIILLLGENGIIREERKQNAAEISFYSSPAGTLLAQSYLYNTLYCFIHPLNYILKYFSHEKSTKEKKAKKKKAKEEIVSLNYFLNNLEKQGIKIIILSYFFPKKIRGAHFYHRYQEECDKEDLGLFHFVKNPNFIFIDLFKLFQKIENFNDLFLEMYLVHPNEKGYEVMAETIGNRLIGEK